MNFIQEKFKFFCLSPLGNPKTGFWGQLDFLDQNNILGNLCKKIKLGSLETFQGTGRGSFISLYRGGEGKGYEERKGVRVVEGVDLERLYDIHIIEGSNPSLSVLHKEIKLFFRSSKKRAKQKFCTTSLFEKHRERVESSRYGGIGRHTSLRGLRILHPSRFESG